MRRGFLTSACLLGLALGVAAHAAPRVELGARTGDTRLVEVFFDEPEFLPAETGGGIAIEMDGAGWIGRPGAPDLPSVQELFELPDRSGVGLRLVDGDYRDLPGVDVAPCQERMATQAEFPLPWVRDERLYAQDGLWPAQAWELGEPVLMRNRRVAKASFFPVQVNPATSTARVWSRMVFELSFAGEDPRNQRVLQLPVGRTSLDRALDRQIVRGVGDGALRDQLFDAGDLPGKYLVFAKATALANPMLSALLDWKRKKGHRVVTVNDSEVSFSSVSAIRSRIISEYNSSDPVAYVMLVGDVDGDYAIATDGTSYDHFYAMIEGGDILGDVAVGRLSVGNANQLATVCAKLLQYESTPYVDEPGWLARAGFTVGSSVCALSMKTLSRGIGAELVQRRG